MRLTEKVSIHDAREIRAFAQSKGIDVFGANCLGVADSWNQIRIGGALGGGRGRVVRCLRRGLLGAASSGGGEERQRRERGESSHARTVAPGRSVTSS